MRRSSPGFTLIELLVAMSAGIVLSLAAFGLLQTASSQVTHNSERTSAQQNGRVAVERLMNALHAGCVGPTVTPIWAAPKATVINSTRLRFVAAKPETTASTTTLPSAMPQPRLYEYEFSSSAHKLIEKQYEKSGGLQPNWSFSSTPAVSRTLLEHVYEWTREQTVEGKTTTETVPVFQYYRYYREAEGTSLRGQIRSTAMTSEELLSEAAGEEEDVSKGEGRGNEVAQVTVTLTAEPKSGNPTSKTRTVADLGTPITDSAVFRVDPASTSNATLDAPCT